MANTLRFVLGSIILSWFRSLKNGRERLKLAGIKNRFQEMEHQFPFGTFRPGNQDYLFKRSVAPGNLPLKRHEKSCSIYFPTGFSGNFLSATIVSAQVTITINVARLLACVAGVRKGRGRELGRGTARGGGGSFPFSLAHPNSRFPFQSLPRSLHACEYS